MLTFMAVQWLASVDLVEVASIKSQNLVIKSETAPIARHPELYPDLNSS